MVQHFFLLRNTVHFYSFLVLLIDLIGKGEQLTEQNILYMIGLIAEGKEDKIASLSTGCVCITAKGRPVKPKTLGQKHYVEAIENNTIVLGVGPAGTGKTFFFAIQSISIRF